MFVMYFNKSRKGGKNVTYTDQIIKNVALFRTIRSILRAIKSDLFSVDLSHVILLFTVSSDLKCQSDEAN